MGQTGECLERNPKISALSTMFPLERGIRQRRGVRQNEIEKEKA
jgi:hypothetical protein